ncbi:MAG: type II toxin-antitoxin system mRNA interferase toxin, RelE/StbE family [Candidatus Paceibacterota bacterium]|jgi:plasmid maintenance system killer protein
MKIAYKATFIKKLNRLNLELQGEVFQKIELFRNPTNHKLLRVHKLHGQFKTCYSFSVNYQIRIIFEYLSKNEAVLLTIGDHQIYQ